MDVKNAYELLARINEKIDQIEELERKIDEYNQYFSILKICNEESESDNSININIAKRLIIKKLSDKSEGLYYKTNQATADACSLIDEAHKLLGK